MNVFVSLVTLVLCYFTRTESVPPEVCFAPFRWDDCGRSPVAVLYYWKPGSRCEVGLWRGCLPNVNMFQDEYECVATCIFSARVGDEDYHKVNEMDMTELDLEATTAAATGGNVTLTGGTSDGNATTVAVVATGATGATGATQGADTNSTGTTGGGAVTGETTPAA